MRYTSLYNQRNWMGEKVKKILIAILVLLLNLSIFPVEVAHAANASLYISPSSSTQAKGKSFTIYVGVNSGGNAVNAFEATVNLPTNIVSISGAGTGGSLCSLFPLAPTVSGSSVRFQCGIPSGTTSSGNLISISLVASNIGSGTASISGARVFAGPGIDVTGGTSGGTFNVIASSVGSGAGKAEATGTSAPAVSSSTHADQSAWYKNNTVTLSWPRAAGVTGYSYIFDQSPGTVPPPTSNFNETTLNLPGKTDGAWYLHIRANGPNGWSAATTYKAQIDTSSPTNLSIETDPKGEADRRPILSFSAEDVSSGIDYYEIKVDQEEFQKATSPYTPGSIKSGDHVFTVRAFDKAGNMTEGKVSIRIKDIPIPKITKPKINSNFKLIQSLDIAGTADSTVKIDLYIDGVNIARGVDVKDDGTWSMTYNSFIKPGKHKITAVSVRDGIESKSSEIVSINIDPSATSIFGLLVPSYIIYIILLVIIGLLAGLSIWLYINKRRNKDKFQSIFKDNTIDTKVEVGNNLSDMERRLQMDILGTYKGEKLLSPEEKYDLEDKIKNEIKTTEKAIIDTIKKETKDR